MIRELLRPSSADLPHTMEMAGQLKFRLMKETSSSEAIIKPTSFASKDGNSPSGTQTFSLETPKIHTKQVPSKKQGELP